MLRNFLSLLFFAHAAFSDTECPVVTSYGDRRSNKNFLRLVQYNVEWLFIDYYNGADCPGNGCTWKNTSQAETHMSYVLDVLKEIQPDIVNFCEIEGCDELNMLSQGLDNSFVPYLKKGTDTSTGQNVGILTKIDPKVSLYRTEQKIDYPIQDSKCGYTGTGTTGVSKHYITEYYLNNMNIALISAHLIAIPTDPIRCSQREGQATILQSIIYDYIQRDYEVIMMGDFNDFDSEIHDVNNNKPNSYVLDILKGSFGKYAGKYELYSAAEMIIQQERYSDWYDSDNNCKTSSTKDYSMIDHVLMTDALRKNIFDTYIYHGYKEYCGKYDSDHYPVVVEFNF